MVKMRNIGLLKNSAMSKTAALGLESAKVLAVKGAEIILAVCNLNKEGRQKKRPDLVTFVSSWPNKP